jgi:anthranilate synthase/aminodeoxychorismate synthase-like glutamine amidotransferase
VIFVLDNYDSFTYNLVQYIGELGEEVKVCRNDQVTVSEVESMGPEKIVVSPGPCTPGEAGISIDLIRHFAGKVPVLGVCLGHQAIGEAFGGRVVRAAHLMHGKTSAVMHDNRTVFQGLPMPMTATRYHSLIVEEKTCPPNSKSAPGPLKKTAPAPSWGCAIASTLSKGCSFIPKACSLTRGKSWLRIFCRCKCCTSAR